MIAAIRAGFVTIVVARNGALVDLTIDSDRVLPASRTVTLPPSEARQVANAILEAADEVEGRRSQL